MSSTLPLDMCTHVKRGWKEVQWIVLQVLCEIALAAADDVSVAEDDVDGCGCGGGDGDSCGSGGGDGDGALGSIYGGNGGTDSGAGSGACAERKFSRMSSISSVLYPSRKSNRACCIL